ncbi:MAG: hypothetical protein RLY57_750 [Candidatus Parcubacteria bacterium]|jgi:hypothetical protein
MKKLFLFSTIALVFFGFSASLTHAQQWSGTYTVNGITVQVNASHKNNQGQYADGSNMDTAMLAKNYAGKALTSANKTFSYSNVSTCGNTTAYTIKVLSCTVTNKCSKDGSYSQNRAKNCKITKTQCGLCGCGANGMCNSCGDVPTEDSCPDGVTIFPRDFVGPLPVNAKYTSKTAADCADRPTCTGPSCSGGGDTGGGGTPGGDTPGGGTTGGDGGVPTCLNVTSDGKCPPPNISFSANPKLISKGGSCNLRWEVEGAETCTLDAATVSATNGTKSVSPDKTTVYKMTCTNGPTSASASQLCSVQDVSEQ